MAVIMERPRRDRLPMRQAAEQREAVQGDVYTQCGAELIGGQSLIQCLEAAKDQRLSVAGDEPARLGQLDKVGDRQPVLSG